MNRITLMLIAIFAFIAHTHGASTRQTDCQRRRLQEQQSTRNQTGVLVPECDENGEYLPMQCFGATVRGRPFCACYDSEFGQIKAPSRNLLSCNCFRTHHDWEHSRESQKGSEPRCNSTSGEFDLVQCSTTHHWCVHPETGEKLGAEINGGCSTELSRVTCARDLSHHGPGSHPGDTAHRGTSSHNGDASHHGDSSQPSGSSSQQSGTSHQSGSGHHDDHSQSGH